MLFDVLGPATDVGGTFKRSLQRKKKGQTTTSIRGRLPSSHTSPGRVLLVERKPPDKSRSVRKLDRADPYLQTGRSVGIGYFFALTYLAVPVMHFVAL